MRFAGPGVTKGCESPCELWKLNLNPLEELSVFLSTESSLQFTHLPFDYILLLPSISAFPFHSTAIASPLASSPTCSICPSESGSSHLT